MSGFGRLFEDECLRHIVSGANLVFKVLVLVDNDGTHGIFVLLKGCIHELLLVGVDECLLKEALYCILRVRMRGLLDLKCGRFTTIALPMSSA